MRVMKSKNTDNMRRERLKITLQLTTFLILAAISWNYLEERSSQNQSSAKNSPKLSDTDLLAVAESLYMPPKGPSLDKKTKELAAFGHDLFFDESFSANGKVSCATCHQPQLSFTDGKVRSRGLRETSLNAPTLVNSGRGHWFFWNGRADSLESQAAGPVEHPGEHGFTRVKVAHRLKNVYQTRYEKLFGQLPKKLPSENATLLTPIPPVVSDEIAAYALATLGNPRLQKYVLGLASDEGRQPIEILKNLAAFGSKLPPPIGEQEAGQELTPKEKEEINKIFTNFTRAIAAFERTIQAADSPFDKFVESFSKTKNSQSALHETFGKSELQGLRIFAGKGQCLVCHNGPNLTDEQFHNIGLPSSDDEKINLGRVQGLLLARSDPLNCQSSYFTDKKQTESCLELGYLESENVDSVGAFKTPTLRQLKHTAPYGHDGRFTRLSEMLQHYNELTASPAVGRKEATLRPLGLTFDELKDLEAFLLSLQGHVSYLRTTQ